MMEFEDEHDDEDQQDREEHEDLDQDDDDEEDDDGDEIQLHQNQHQQQHHFNNNNNNNNLTHQQLPYKFEIKKHNPQLNQQQLSSASVARYRECLKNHAVNIGGHAVDGCGEFMPAGPDGTLDALKCAACNCHRNFHRKEFLIDTTTNNNNQLTIFSPRPHHAYHPPPPPPHQVFQFYPTGRGAGPTSSFATPPQVRPLALTPAGGGSGYAEEMIGGMATMTVTSSGKKRFRTKFTPEQKEKMFGFAERVGWRIQKQDEGLVQEFCNESGVKRHVLKVWMHNNKHTLGKKP